MEYAAPLAAEETTERDHRGVNAMRRAFLAGLLLFVPSLAWASDWTTLAGTLNKAVVYIEHEGGSCTGVIVNDSYGDDGKRDLVLTAAHCDAEAGKAIYADQERASVHAKDVKNDFMILNIPDTGRPSIKLAKHDPKQAEEVMSFGYGYGLEQPMARITHISIDRADIPELSGPYVVTDATFVGGQSGGPVVNALGELVMMVQRGSNSVGIGKGVETIRNKVGKFCDKTP
jgi:S1-C subfamily serine protease